MSSVKTVLFIVSLLLVIGLCVSHRQQVTLSQSDAVLTATHVALERASEASTSSDPIIALSMNSEATASLRTIASLIGGNSKLQAVTGFDIDDTMSTLRRQREVILKHLSDHTLSSRRKERDHDHNDNMD
jgi:hypothetical protein